MNTKINKNRICNPYAITSSLQFFHYFELDWKMKKKKKDILLMGAKSSLYEVCNHGKKIT